MVGVGGPRAGVEVTVLGGGVVADALGVAVFPAIVVVGVGVRTTVADGTDLVAVSVGVNVAGPRRRTVAVDPGVPASTDGVIAGVEVGRGVKGRSVGEGRRGVSVMGGIVADSVGVLVALVVGDEVSVAGARVGVREGSSVDVG